MFRPGRENGAPRHEINRYRCVIFCDASTQDNLSDILLTAEYFHIPQRKRAIITLFYLVVRKQVELEVPLVVQGQVEYGPPFGT